MTWRNWLSTHFDIEGSTSEAKGTASTSGEATSISLSLSASAVPQSGETLVNSSAIAVIEADDMTLTLTGGAEASGETVSTLSDLSAEIDEEDGEMVVTGSASTEAEAVAGEDGTASATTSADAELEYDDVVIAEDHDEASEVGESVTAESTAILDTVVVEAAEFEAVEASLQGLGTAIWF
jgi:hypothetical protein